MSAGPIVTVHGSADGRQMRVFARTFDGAIDWTEIAAQDLDESDLPRLQVLAAAVRSPRVTATAHPGVDPPDVLHVYLDVADVGRVFACVVVSETRLQTMLDEAPRVVEGLWLQVAPGPHLTADSVRAALQAWSARCFGEPVPVFLVRPWLEPPEELELGVVEVGVLESSLEDAFAPPPGLAEPAYHEEAA